MAAAASVWFVPEIFRPFDCHSNRFSSHLPIPAWHDSDPMMVRITLNCNYEVHEIHHSNFKVFLT